MEYSTNNIQSLLTIFFVSSLVLSSLSAVDAICVRRAFSVDNEGHSKSPAPSPVVAARQPPPVLHSAAQDSTVKSSVQGIVSSIPVGISREVRNICDNTDYSLLCVSSLVPFLADGKADLLSVLSKEIRACSDATERALAAVGKLLRDSATDADTKELLDQCQENYDDAVDDLKDAASVIPTGDIGRLNSVLSSAVTNFGTCEDGFAEASVESPTATFYEPLRKLASNCLAIASLIHNIKY